MYDQKLITYLENNTHIQKVYMNETGGWLLHPRSEFPIEVDREKILKVGAKPNSETATTETATTGTTDKVDTATKTGTTSSSTATTAGETSSSNKTSSSKKTKE